MGQGRSRKQSRYLRKHATYAPPVLESPKKRIRWSNESMEAAVKAIYNGCNIKRAALEINAPRMTLQD